VADVVTPAERSRMMSNIKGANTRPERLVRSFLHRQGLRFRLHGRKLPGKPDLVFPKYRCVVFVHGCFWHRHPGCKYAYNPKSRVDFWQKKFAENVTRDARNISELRDRGWRVLVVWECSVTNTEHLIELAREIQDAGRSLHGGTP
jgi:DNA mismatch endonuclease, patch repair protein